MRTNKNLFLNIFWIVLGSVLVVISTMGVIGNIYTGFGGGLVVVGIIQLIRAIRYKSDPKFKENIDIAIRDERNSYLRIKAWSWAGYLFVMISSAVTIICMVLSLEIYMQMASCAVCLMLILYWGSYCILCRKY